MCVSCKSGASAGDANRAAYHLLPARSRNLEVNATKRSAEIWPVVCVLALSLLSLRHSAVGADLPRTLLNEPPRILGRPVQELVLSGTVPVGRDLPPGLPTTTTFKMTPNRFRPVAEDAEGVFYQALGPLQKHMSMYRGGVYMSKEHPDMICPYLGNAANVRLPVRKWEPLHPGHARKFRIVFAGAERSGGKRKNSG
jgi:hypothetical protein